jgi:hypothetical protein
MRAETIYFMSTHVSLVDQHVPMDVTIQSSGRNVDATTELEQLWIGCVENQECMENGHLHKQGQLCHIFLLKFL